MENTVRGWYIPRDRKLSDDRPFCARECSYVTLSSNLFQVRCNQPSVTAALDPDLIQVGRKARVGRCNVR
jgi:hypothetical protein